VDKRGSPLQQTLRLSSYVPSLDGRLEMLVKKTWIAWTGSFLATGIIMAAVRTKANTGQVQLTTREQTRVNLWLSLNALSSYLPEKLLSSFPELTEHASKSTVDIYGIAGMGSVRYPQPSEHRVLPIIDFSVLQDTWHASVGFAAPAPGAVTASDRSDVPIPLDPTVSPDLYELDVSPC